MACRGAAPRGNERRCDWRIFGVDCGATSTALDSSTGTLGSTTLTGTISVGISSAFTYTGTWFKLTATSTGTYTSTHNATSTYHVSTALSVTGAQIRETNATTPCGTTPGTVKCAALALPNGISLSSSTGTSTQAHPGPVGTFTGSSGSATISAFGCTAPFSALNGKTLTITGLGVAFA